MIKPRLFIGSSSENANIAYAAQANLDSVAEVVVWDQGFFGISQATLDAILQTLDECDCGLFIFAPDDLTNIRGGEYQSVRDNVLFELGLFIGRLGKDRSFILAPSNFQNMRIPSDLLGITRVSFNPDRRDKNLRAALGPACYDIRRQLQNIQPQHRQSGELPIPKLVPRSEFTKMLLSRIEDSEVKTIKMITYTGEVDSSILDRYRLVPNKTIEVYKRSILTDLSEQQEWNLKRLAAGTLTRHWSKRWRSIRASESLAKEAASIANLTQYLYVAPPTKRAYIFDDKEAIVAYYEVAPNLLEEEGSVYNGITSSPAMKISSDDPYGKFILGDLEHLILSLRISSRTWEEEKGILLDGKAWKGGGRRPCVKPKAVFFDLDGILLNSLPFYVCAWKEAFKLASIDFPEQGVYEQEGRRGKDTIVNVLTAHGLKEIPDETIHTIQEKKRETLANLGPPPIQEGAVELVTAVINSGLDVWVVTGSSAPEIKDRVHREFQGLIQKDKIITGEEPRAGKPNPDPYLLACSKAKTHPHESIAIENAPLGIQAADGAGLFCIAVNTGILDDRILQEAGARVVFRTCKELAEKWSKVIEILSE